MKLRSVSAGTVIIAAVGIGVWFAVDNPTERSVARSDSLNTASRIEARDEMKMGIRDAPAVDTSALRIMDKTLKEKSLQLTGTLNAISREIKEQAPIEERIYQDIYEKTLERLKDTSKPQTVHGFVGFAEILESKGEKKCLYAKVNGISRYESAIINGRFSFGTMEPDTYKVFIGETQETPGVTKHALEVKPNQPSLQWDFSLGECDVQIEIVDQLGRPYESPGARLVIGGTDSDSHTWKTCVGIEKGNWAVKYLFDGPHIITIDDGNKKMGTLCHLVHGDNHVRLVVQNAP